MGKTVFYDHKVDISKTSLILFEPNAKVTTYPLNQASQKIGRSSPDRQTDIPVHSPVVSRSHGEIDYRQDGYWYCDLHSTNGTFVNQTPLGVKSSAGEIAVRLHDGDIIHFDHASRFDPQKHTFALFAQYANAGCHWNYVQLHPGISEICIGRMAQAGLQIDNPMISEQHASFFRAEHGWAIIDHQSTNGVFLNGRRLGEPQYLKPYDVVRMIDTYFIFLGDGLFYSESPPHAQKTPDFSKNPGVQNPPPPPESNGSAQLVINIMERSVMQRFKKMMLLQDINLTVNQGEMVLILGGSGAGKTTFINAVMGYEKALGKIAYKNTDIYAEYQKMKYEIGFVPQQDLLRNSDTVYDTLANAAEMKLPAGMMPQEKERRIGAVLEELGLTRECHSLVSKLSGGQKKRLNIAVELIANPSLFFLDEPDSGLDAIMGRGLMENLRKIADRGTIVMMITHAPDRAKDLFDKVIVLAKSVQDNCGHLAFFGTVDEAFRFFEVDSLEKIVKRINRPDENGEGLSDFYINKYKQLKG